MADIYIRDLYLGGRPVGFGWASTYFRLLPEVNTFEVQNAGFTNFARNTSYVFAGGTFSLRTVFFENTPGIPDLLCGRFYLNGQAQGDLDEQGKWVYLNGQARTSQDQMGKKDIWNYSAEFGYNLSPTSTQACGTKLEPKDPSASTAGGPNTPPLTAAIALNYFQGVDPATLFNQTQYKVSLKFKF
jgi:hypothetical protein